MDTQQEAEFYVGYLGAAPEGIARWNRRTVWCVVLVSVLLALALLLGMRPFSASVFEFGVEREFQGTLREAPVPTLVVQRPGSEQDSSYLLVSFGKRGAGAQVEGLEGKEVKLRGSLIFREERTMIELVEGSLEELDPAGTQAAPVEALGEQLGEVTLVGEIVDSKCFLGVMKPGNLKPHRACATRCIAGGIPPILMVRVSPTATRSFVLVDDQGGALNEHVLDRIAEPVQVTGRWVQHGDLDFLYANHARIERWSAAED